MARDGMMHALHVYNQDIAIFTEALNAEGSISASFLVERLPAKGGIKMLLSTEDLKLIYNGMAKLEVAGVESQHGDEAALLQREKGGVGGPYHPWGYDPVLRFRNWQKWILERV